MASNGSCIAPPRQSTGAPVSYQLSKCPVGWRAYVMPSGTQDDPTLCPMTGQNVRGSATNAYPVCQLIGKQQFMSCPGADYANWAATTNALAGQAEFFGAGVCASATDGTALVATGCDKTRPTGCAFYSLRDGKTPLADPPTALYPCEQNPGGDFGCMQDRFVCDRRDGLCRNVSVLGDPKYASIDPKTAGTHAACASGCTPAANFACKKTTGGGFACVQDPAGTMTYDQCGSDTKASPDCAASRWVCDPQQGCVPATNGNYPTRSACETFCKSRCSSNGCVVSDNPALTKQYDTPEACAADCGFHLSTVAIVLIAVAAGLVVIAFVLWLLHKKFGFGLGRLGTHGGPPPGRDPAS